MKDEDLKALAVATAQCRSLASELPEWSEVVDRSARLTLGASLANAAVATGLAVDASDMAIQDHWPKDVVEALRRLGLLNKYSPTSGSGVLRHLSDAQLTGLESSVKGTSFEIQAADGINHGTISNLPHGVDHAVLAGTLNQKAWDAIGFRDGEMVDQLQMKATVDWHVLADHLARYPEYQDLVTTHEAAKAAAEHGLDAGNIVDSGITDASLTDQIDGPLSHLGSSHVLHEFAPEVAFGFIAAFAIQKLRRGESKRAVARWTREQAVIAGVANLAGLMVQIATGTVFLRPVATIGTRFAAARGKRSRLVAERMALANFELEELLRTIRVAPEAS